VGEVFLLDRTCEVAAALKSKRIIIIVGRLIKLPLTHTYTQLLVHFYDDYHWKIVPDNFLRLAGVLSLSKHLHPPLVYSEFLKRNEDALLICVVGGRQTPTTACYFIFIEYIQWR
jgi:hypothetical protein